MPLQVEILGEDNHLFSMEIESVLLTPHVGDTVICGNCGKKTKVKRVTPPGRVKSPNTPKSQGQGKLFKE